MLKNYIKIYFKKSLNEKIKLFFGQEYFKNRIVLWLLSLGIFLNVIIWLLLKFLLRSGGSSIILHYNVYFGVDSIGASHEVYVLPFIGCIIFFLNLFLSFYFYIKKERVASYVLLLTMLMVQGGLLISAISVIIINY